MRTGLVDRGGAGVMMGIDEMTTVIGRSSSGTGGEVLHFREGREHEYCTWSVLGTFGKMGVFRAGLLVFRREELGAVVFWDYGACFGMFWSTGTLRMYQSFRIVRREREGKYKQG